VTELADAVEKTVKEFHRQLAAIAAQKTELGKRVESEAEAMRQQFAKVGSSIATAREELAKAIEAAKTQFATPAGLNPAGDWKAGSYERLDVVTVNGTSYVAIRATEEKPSARARDWQVLARRGAGTVSAGGTPVNPESAEAFPAGTSAALQLTGGFSKYGSVTVNGNFEVTIDGGYSVLARYVLRIVGDGSIRTLTFPSGWKWIGAAPTALAANATGILSITSWGNAAADVVAAYGVAE
jgi:hypothetical protein